MIAMGPWSIAASDWLPLPQGLRAEGPQHHLRDRHGSAWESLYLEYQEAGRHGDYAGNLSARRRRDYVCAISSESPVPEDPADVAPIPGALKRLEAAAIHLSPSSPAGKDFGAAGLLPPVTQDSLPLIGAIPGIAGAYVATGHSVWGILNAPATGEAMAELIWKAWREPSMSRHSIRGSFAVSAAEPPLELLVSAGARSVINSGGPVFRNAPIAIAAETELSAPWRSPEGFNPTSARPLGR